MVGSGLEFVQTNSTILFMSRGKKEERNRTCTRKERREGKGKERKRGRERRKKEKRKKERKRNERRRESVCL